MVGGCSVRMFVAALSLLCVLIGHSSASSAVVKLQLGTLEGRFDDRQGVTSFLGVPYAEPPVGDRRFAPPGVLGSWIDTHDGTKLKPACPQDLGIYESSGRKENDVLSAPFEVSEDCLYLNIFVPGEVNSNNDLPVVVFIHDGMFQLGSAGGVDHGVSSARDNVIVVTISYRLGVLGFLGENNYGLWDQNMALRWIKDNIKQFGGSPDQVTLAGSGSGAFAVGLHVVANVSNGLFQRAMSFGASPFQTEYTLSSASSKQAGASFGKRVSCCPVDLDCLRNLPLDKILETQRSLAQISIRFLPSYDEVFLLPSALNKENASTRVTDYVVGFDSNAGAEFVQSQLNNPISKEEFKRHISDFSRGINTMVADSLAEMILFEYDSVSEVNPRDALAQVRRDAVAGATRLLQSRLTRAGINVYAYFTQSDPKSSHHFSQSSYEVQRSIFGSDGAEGSRSMQELWTSFLKTNTPTMTVDGATQPLPKFDETSKQMMEISADLNPRIVTQLPDDIEEHIEFWSEVIPNMASSCETCNEEVGSEHDGPIISLEQGKVRGEKVTLKDGYFYEFYQGIPFARPPIGELRFEPPQPHPGWSEIREPRKIPIACPQLFPMMQYAEEEYSEDCLLLDVYVPQTVDKTREKNLPVMVYVHGGGYHIGSKNLYNGAAQTMYDVIVVTINYRLGVLGFLSTDDDVLPGNYGLMDQQLAFKWVKSNIGRFGGDSNRITIVGESAGAGSVTAQMLAPSNKGLFQNVIAQSGGSRLVSLQLEAFKDIAIRIGKLFNCPVFNSYVTRECLRLIDPSVLSTLNNSLDLSDLSVVFFRPRENDGHLFPKNFDELYADGVTSQYNLVIGNTEHEGYMIIALLQDIKVYRYYFDETKLLGRAFAHVHQDLLAARSRDGWQNDTDYIMSATNTITDFIINAHVEHDTKMHYRNGGTAYRYVMRYRTDHPGFFGVKTPENIYGTHGEDLLLTFGHPLVNAPNNRWELPDNFTYPARDVDMSRRFLMAWSNIAHTGNPNDGPSSFDYEWPAYTDATPSVFTFREHLDKAKGLEAVLNMNDHPELFRPQSMKFWNEVAPTLIKEDREIDACVKTSVKSDESAKTEATAGAADQGDEAEVGSSAETRDEL